MRERQTDVVTASEIGSWSFCPEAWRLGQGLKLRPENDERLVKGERSHRQTASVDRFSRIALTVGLVLVVVGSLAVAVCLFAIVRG